MFLSGIRIVTKRKQAFRNLCKNPTQENVVEYKRCRAVAKKTIKNAKRTCRRAFCDKLGSNTPVRQIWARIHKMSGKVVRAKMPVLNDGETEIVNKGKADMCVICSRCS